MCAASCRRRSASGSASMPRRRPPPCCASPTIAWPARCAWCRCRAATIRATSRCSPSAAPAPCTRPRWPASWAFPTVLVPARPGITNALGCVVADLRHDYVRTVNKPLVRRRRRHGGAHLRRAGGRGRGDDRARGRAGARAAPRAFGRHAVPGAEPHPVGRRRQRRHRRRGPAQGLCRRLLAAFRHRAGRRSRRSSSTCTRP